MTLRDKCCCLCEAGVSGTNQGMIAVLIQITGVFVLVALLCPGGSRSKSTRGSMRFNGVTVGRVLSTWALFFVLVVLLVTQVRLTAGTSRTHHVMLALLRPIPWLEWFEATPPLDKPSTLLDRSAESHKKKPLEARHPSPYHLDIFFDYEEGLEHARRVDKPVLIHFTGHDCKQSRTMEFSVWSDPDVLGYLHNEYVIIQLYVDDKSPLPLREHAISPHTGKAITTLGNKWSDLQAMRFGTDAQPYYAIVSSSGKELIPGTGAEYDIDVYAKFLSGGVKAFQSRSKSIL